MPPPSPTSPPPVPHQWWIQSGRGSGVSSASETKLFHFHGDSFENLGKINKTNLTPFPKILAQALSNRSTHSRTSVILADHLIDIDEITRD